MVSFLGSLKLLTLNPLNSWELNCENAETIPPTMASERLLSAELAIMRISVSNPGKRILLAMAVISSCFTLVVISVSDFSCSLGTSHGALIRSIAKSPRPAPTDFFFLPF